MKNILYIAILAFLPSLANAENIRGRITDYFNIPVEAAQIEVFNSDSTFVCGTATSRDGSFNVMGDVSGDAILKIITKNEAPKYIRFSKGYIGTVKIHGNKQRLVSEQPTEQHQQEQPISQD